MDLSLLQTTQISAKNILIALDIAQYLPISSEIGSNLGPFNVTRTVRVTFLTCLSLNGYGQGGFIWVRSYNYKVTEWSQSLSSNPGTYFGNIEYLAKFNDNANCGR